MEAGWVFREGDGAAKCSVAFGAKWPLGHRACFGGKPRSGARGGPPCPAKEAATRALRYLPRPHAEDNRRGARETWGRWRIWWYWAERPFGGRRSFFNSPESLRRPLPPAPPTRDLQVNTRILPGQTPQAAAPAYAATADFAHARKLAGVLCDKREYAAIILRDKAGTPRMATSPHRAQAIESRQLSERRKPPIRLLFDARAGAFADY